jgi:hypothetical protein
MMLLNPRAEDSAVQGNGHQCRVAYRPVDPIYFPIPLQGLKVSLAVNELMAPAQ